MPAARRHVQSAQDNDDLASRADRLYVAAMSNHQKPVSPAPVRPIIIGRINFIGLRAFYYREVMRFVKIITQTVFAPILTAALFMAVFAVAIGERLGTEGGLDYIIFLAPGLIMMQVLQNAFANTSTSFVVSKVQGNIVDMLMPPIGPVELLIAMTAAGVTRGILVGIVTAVALWFFGASGWPVHPLTALIFLLLGSTLLSLIGVMAGIWANKFDNLATITNFIIQPMVFLSGTFYSIDRLPPPFATIASYNPVFHMIDGYRYGVTGVASFPPLYGMLVLTGLVIAVGILCWRMLDTGYKLKS